MSLPTNLCGFLHLLTGLILPKIIVLEMLDKH